MSKKELNDMYKEIIKKIQSTVKDLIKIATTHTKRLDRLEKTMEIAKIRIIALMRATKTELPPEDYDRIVEIRRKEGEG